MMRQLTVKRAQEIVGGELGDAGKMPCRTWGLPAAECKVGSILRKTPGTPCAPDPANGYAGCFAHERGNYMFKSTISSQYHRLDCLVHPEWVDAMVLLIGRYSPQFFRWHDSGDLRDVHHLDNIVQVARRLPECKFWMPTQERKTVALWRKANGALPVNLTIRPSMVMIGQHTGQYNSDPELCTSMVIRKGQSSPEGAYLCPSKYQGNKCGDCRACWDRSVKIVAYCAH